MMRSDSAFAPVHLAIACIISTYRHVKRNTSNLIGQEYQRQVQPEAHQHQEEAQVEWCPWEQTQQ